MRLLKPVAVRFWVLVPIHETVDVPGEKDPIEVHDPVNLIEVALPGVNVDPGLRVILRNESRLTRLEQLPSKITSYNN
jgi:hypothetical protein